MTSPNPKPENGSPDATSATPETEPGIAAPDKGADPQQAIVGLRPEGAQRQVGADGSGQRAAEQTGAGPRDVGHGGVGQGGAGQGGAGPAVARPAGGPQGGVVQGGLDQDGQGPRGGFRRPPVQDGAAVPATTGAAGGAAPVKPDVAAKEPTPPRPSAEPHKQISLGQVSLSAQGGAIQRPQAAPTPPSPAAAAQPPAGAGQQAMKPAAAQIATPGPRPVVTPLQPAAKPLPSNLRPDQPAAAPVQKPAPVENKAPMPKPDVRPEARPAPAKQEKALHPATASYVPAPTVGVAPMRRRHWVLVALFILIVVLPTAGYGWYLYTFAADQYESDAGFSSRTENAPSAFSFLGALGGVAGSSSSDMDIVYQFIGSQELVTRVDQKLNLRKIFSKPKNDPLLSFPATGPIEDLVDYWQSMVVPSYDRSTGLMTLTVFAFDAKDAQDIAKEVLLQSTAIINELSKTAQDDATRYSKESLTKAESRMAEAQQSLIDFRIQNNILDPAQQLAGTAQVVNSLVQQLGAAEIDLDMLTGTVPDTDPRIAMINRRIEVIQKRMTEEQSKVGGLSDPGAPNYAKLVSQYQNLLMEQDFSQKAYLTALAAYDQAVNDAQHKTRYLATYLEPTLAESSTAPMRLLRTLLTALVGMLAWSIITMIYYALRDRR